MSGSRAGLIAALVLGMFGAALLTVTVLGRPPTAALVTASPADGSRVEVRPARIVLTFRTAIAEAHLGVNGRPPPAAATIDGSTVTQPVTIASRGPCLITYHVVSLAGDEVTGSVSFVVAGDGAAPAAAPQPHTTHSHNARPDPVTAVLMAATVLVVLVLGVRFNRTRSRRHRPQ